MLVTFRCKASANVTMFGDIAVRLLNMMGHSGTVPGAVVAKDVPHALALLTTAIEAEKKKAQPQVEEDDDETVAEVPVSIANRAIPLIALLTAAAKKACDVMWEEGC